MSLFYAYMTHIKEITCNIKVPFMEIVIDEEIYVMYIRGVAGADPETFQRGLRG